MSQILNGRGVTARYDAEALRIEGGGRQTRIPFAAVQEVRTPEARVLEIVLTDGAAHRVEGGNPSATAAFATALTGVLPPSRDPAGSALVTTAETGELSVWWLFGPLIALTLGYIGYAWWVGARHGVWVLGAIAAPLPLLVGLVLFFGGVEETCRRITLARRGITVEAYASTRRLMNVSYRYTDADGGEHFYSCARTVQRTHVVYDPRNPASAAHVQWLPFLLVKLAFVLTVGALLLACGAFLALGWLW
ncbi:PH domain-containing protein [Streptomyces sp. enrichment culture]|uniref:PH domain-containing protein n=1 Tax=Streptomyces sp. enrichment culture TaxID=1795815 RepID=UPI003F54C30E